MRKPLKTSKPSDMKKILVTGANGQLGRCLMDLAELKANPELKFIFLNRSHLDISRKDLIETFFFSNHIDYCINCAAYTNVDLAETEVEQAFSINSDGPAYLAEECSNQKAVLIHISTDYVFDGTASLPYLPNDPTHPLNVYGKSKLDGEKRVMALNPNSIIIRTSWLYSRYGKNFYTGMLRLMAEREELNIVNDQIGKPTNANDLAAYIYQLIETGNTDFGIHHFAGPDQMSWYGFALKIAKENGFKTKINPIPTSQYPTPAVRPKWSVLG